MFCCQILKCLSEKRFPSSSIYIPIMNCFILVVLWYSFSFVIWCFVTKQHGSVYWKTGSGEVLRNLSEKSTLEEQLQVNLFLLKNDLLLLHAIIAILSQRSDQICLLFVIVVVVCIVIVKFSISILLSLQD